MRSRHTRLTPLAGDSDFLKRNGMAIGSVIYSPKPAPIQNVHPLHALFTIVFRFYILAESHNKR
jgi:hypothetical protein